MKSFMNAARIAVITLLFVSLTALGGGCCGNSCAVKAPCAVGCKLQPEPVKIRKVCDKPGFYKQVCHLEYEPCDGTVEEYTAMPIFKGCFDEQGNPLSSNGSNGYGYADKNVRVVDADIQVQVPRSYDQTSKKGFRASRNGKRTNKSFAEVTVAE